MATEVSMFSLAQIQNHAQQQQMPKPGLWSWTAGHRAPAADDGSNWEVRAFAEDRGSFMDITWPPRSYACTFCSREFRSAQALGGHMNVHRRERARLHQSNQAPDTPFSNNSNPSIIFPPPQFIPSNGLHLFYPIRTPPMVVSDVPSNEPAQAALNLFPGKAGCIKKSMQGITSKDSGDAVVVEDMDLELRL